MVWAFCAGIWLMIVAVVIAFFYGELKAEREQD